MGRKSHSGQRRTGEPGAPQLPGVATNWIILCLAAVTLLVAEGGEDCSVRGKPPTIVKAEQRYLKAATFSLGFQVTRHRDLASTSVSFNRFSHSNYAECQRLPSILLLGLFQTTPVPERLLASRPQWTFQIITRP